MVPYLFAPWEFFVVCRFFQNQRLRKMFSGIPPECQTDWIKIRPDCMSGLILIQSVCKRIRQTTLVGKQANSSTKWYPSSISFAMVCYFCHIKSEFSNSEIFARRIFSRKALKDIFGTFKICDLDMIYLHQLSTEWFRHFGRVLFSWNSATSKFSENKTLAKISEFTVDL